MIPSKEDESVMSNQLKFFWDFGRKLFGSFGGSSGLDDSQSVGYSVNVGIYGNDGLFVEDVLDDFCGFFTYAGEFDEVCFFGRNGISTLTPLFHEELCSLENVFRFGFVVIYGANGFFELLWSHFYYVRRSFNGCKKLVGNSIHLLIGGLGGHHHGNKELKRGFVIEFGIEFGEERGNVGEEVGIVFEGSFHW
jgi:hypothetical protein